jgi:hypothetical protein
MDQCIETRGGTPALVGLSEVIITPAAEFWEDYRQLRSSGVRSSRRFCVQEGGFEGPEIGSMQRRINNRLLSYRPRALWEQLFLLYRTTNTLAIPHLLLFSFVFLARPSFSVHRASVLSRLAR